MWHLLLSICVSDADGECLPCLTLVSGGLPAEESHPPVVQSGHIAQGTPRHRAEASVMMRLNQGIPAFPLCGQDGAHLKAVQGGSLVRAECWGVHAVKTTATIPGRS